MDQAVVAVFLFSGRPIAVRWSIGSSVANFMLEDDKVVSVESEL